MTTFTLYFSLMFGLTFIILGLWFDAFQYNNKVISTMDANECDIPKCVYCNNDEESIVVF